MKATSFASRTVSRAKSCCAAAQCSAAPSSWAGHSDRPRRPRPMPRSRSAAERSASASPAVRRRTSSTARTSSPAPTRRGSSRAGRRSSSSTPQFKLTFNGLAEEITANKAATVWTIRVRDGIEFHNGKTLSADDVIYSIKRLINPKLELFGGAALELDRSEPDQEARQAHRPPDAEAAGRHDPRRARPVHRGHRPRGLQPERRRQGEAEHRHRPVQGQELHAGPAERRTSATRTTGAPASRTSTRS